jgi:hypothetical protein
MKELLFNGAKREIKGKFELNDPDQPRLSGGIMKEVTPFELFEAFKAEMPEKEYKSLRIILVRFKTYKFRIIISTIHV